jgi:hypothetical protein
MARQVQLKDLFSDRFLREIHHLLWLEASTAGAAMDGGWNCRDHAWISALLSLALGHTASLVSGEAFFSKDATAASSANSFHVKPHNWTWIHGVGAIDLSVKPVSRIAGNEFQVPIKCIFASEWIPRRKNSAYFLQDAAQFAHAVEVIPGQHGQATAIYLASEAEYPHVGHLSRAAGWIGSALTDWLDAVYGNPSDIYASLFLHLGAFLEGRARSLAVLPFEKAWAVIASEREGAIDGAHRYIEDRADPRAAFQQDSAAALPA